MRENLGNSGTEFPDFSIDNDGIFKIQMCDIVKNSITLNPHHAVTKISNDVGNGFSNDNMDLVKNTG